MAKSWYRIEYLLEVEDGMNLRLGAGVFFGTKEEVIDIAESPIEAQIREDCIYLYIKGTEVYYLDNSPHYSFELFVKDTPEPVKVSGLSDKELENLFKDSQYISTEDDYERMDLLLTDVYDQLITMYPDKRYFKLNVLSYSVEPIEL